MDKYDISNLTEFPRFEPETPQSGVSSFFTKIWKIPLFAVNESTGNSQNALSNQPQQGPANTQSSSVPIDHDNDSLDPAFPVVPEARSLPNVLKRISSLVALGSGGGMRYADTELARYWMPDDISRECYECADRFSALRRRHHCRVCGQIFCNRCCSQRVPGQIFGCAGGLRVCTYCSNVVLSYLREHELSGDMSPDLKSLQENLQVKFPENKSNEQPRKDFLFAGEADERRERSGNKDSLQDVFRQLSFHLPTHQHRYRLVRYNDVWRGCDILQWVMENTQNKTRAQANLICQGLINEGFLLYVTDVTKFLDYGLYKPITMPPVHSQEDSPEENNRIVESVSSYCLDLNLGDNSARLIKATKCEKKSPSSEEESPLIQATETLTEQKKVCEAIAECGEDHLKLLLRQCLARQGLPASWLTIIYPLCQKAAQIITPDLNSNMIDIRKYVQIKKIPSGHMKDSIVVGGVVLTKHVTHRAMPQDLQGPSVLLLDCSIAYQRVEGKLTSLEPLLLQEQQYLVRCAARISALQPNVVLVKGTAARTVQDALRKDGVALATGVGERALRRLSRCIDADVVTSVDSRVALPKLGTCQRFYLNHYAGKTLMFLEGCAKPHLGCSILLRGAPLQELIRVKKVVKFMLLACYNWRLEHSFLNDIEAVLPEPGMTFDDDINDVIKNDNDVTNDVKGDKAEINDPLINKFVRKIDSDKTLSCGVPIRDFSDPLRSSQIMSVDDEVFLPKEENKLKTDATSVRWSADDAVLSMSPNIIISPPYLATEAGRKCHLRQYFNDPLFPEDRPQTLMTPKSLRRKISKQSDCQECTIKEMHPFIRDAITRSADDVSLRASLAHFRATGSVYTNTHLPNCPKFKASMVKRGTPKELETDPGDKPAAILDPLAPENHQRLSLLLYSYSDKSANVPDFCVNPWIVTMEMYGQHDISLGAFLEKYCFNNDYKCPSGNCQIPMNQHVRRFIHEDGCITITCNTVNHSSGDKSTQGHKNQITVWTRCTHCGVSNRSARLSPSSSRLSLASYLQLRSRAPHYRPACRHLFPAHYFHAAATCARVRYHKITTWDVELPPHVITTKYDTKLIRDTLISQINEVMLKGHEVFSVLSEVDCEKEHASFKQQIEQIHLSLTSETLLQQTTAHGVVRWLWSIGDKIIIAEKLLRDVVEKLTPNYKTKSLLENLVDEKPDVEDCMVGDPTVNEVTDAYKVDSDHQGEEDEEKGDKKTVRQILSQLLTNNQPSNQSGIIISGGIIPVTVYAGEIGSVIAATLASVQYQRQLHSLMAQSISHASQSDPEETEHANNNKDKTDGDKSKAAKNNEHIEVLLKDGLLCRVYYAAQFQKLRTMLLCPLDNNPNILDEFADVGNTEGRDEAKVEDCKDKNDSRYRIEEGFIRSLSRCEFWAARGGKSGSTFCKTKDDRYVLKEMSKPEWQQFLEFAPKYFTYVINCHQNNLPTLLARIIGVFSVAGTGVLVMENLLYDQPSLSRRFDLKGASRHRLMADTQDAVLMDENMLNMRWETPLFLSSPAARVLWAAVERDTRFLTTHDVMDYSLLLGVGDGKLVLGVIDYIRTFTWDKKLEHYVKKNLGSGQPTVVSPEQYKQRFCAAMRKYFLHCPTQWDDLDTGLRHKV